MFCKNCGEQLSDDAKFCSKCGTEIKDYKDSGNRNIINNVINRKRLMMALVLGIICILVCVVRYLLMDGLLPKNHDDEVMVNSNTSQQMEYYSEEEYNTYKYLAEELSQIEKRYTDEDGFIKEEYIDNVWQLVQEQIEQEKVNGTIEKCIYDENHKLAYVKFISGIQYMYIPYIEGSLSAGEDNKIITLEPDATSYGFLISAFMTWVDKEYNDLEFSGSYSVPNSAQLLADSIDLYKYDRKNDYIINKNVTVERAKTLSDYKVVIWEGHGGYISDVHSALITSDLDSSYAESYRYAEDLQDGCLIFAGTGALQKYAITSKFVDKYLGEMDDTLVFLGGCYTAKDRVLADSFLNKGAMAVVGYSDSVSIEYEMLTRANFFYSLSLNGITSDTVKQAMEYARIQIGAEDPWKKEATEMYLFLSEDEENHVDNNENYIVGDEEAIEYDDVVIEQEISEGEYVGLIGTLIRREDGNLVVKLENPALFHGNGVSYVIEDVGLTGTNNLLVLEDILNGVSQ